MRTIMRDETWVSGRESFMFRCVRSNGEKWTFVVDRTTLEELNPDERPARTFEAYRSRIYDAARRKMALSNPGEQHVITAADLGGGAKVKGLY